MTSRNSSHLLHGALFVASVITISAAGLVAAQQDPFQPGSWTGEGGLEAVAYLLWMMAIIGAHEAGHYVAARRRGVDVSRPYFLPGVGPFPELGVIPFFGTFGAFMRVQWEKATARDLLAVAGWGPVAGFSVTVPAVVIGVALSEPIVVDDKPLLVLGDSLLIVMATAVFHPELKDGMELMLHPIGLAGWVGCLLTALNLLPMGQLDGGHLLYGIFGRRADKLALAAFAGLIAIGILWFPGWLLLAALVWWMGVRHPPMLDGPPAGSGERTMAWAGVAMFALTFTPAPVVVDALPQWIGG